MKNYNLIITDNRDFDEIFGINSLENDVLTVYHDEELSFENNLKNLEQFRKDKKSELDIQFDLAQLEDDDRHYNESKRIWDYFENNFDNIYEAIDYIVLDIDGDDFDFIENHPILKDKKSVICYNIDITNFDLVDSLSNKFKEYSNIYVSMQGNTEYVNLKDCFKIMNEIKSKADFVKSLNLSPLESIMVAYDLVRDRVYTKEKDENWMNSRDLKNVLFGNEIVCVGYSRILACILDHLGIENNLVHLSDTNRESGHLRNSVYVEDPKYNVNGFYYLDATWDSKRKDSDSFLYKYLYFLKTPKEMKELEKEQNIEYIYADGEKDIKKIINAINNIYSDESIEYGFDFMDLAIRINSLYRKAYHSKKNLINTSELCGHVTNFKDIVNQENLIDTLIEIDKKINAPIPAETYINLVNNVRKIEYYINPEKYPYSLDVLYNIYLKSGWNFANKHLNPKDLLLCRIFGQDEESIYEPEKDFINYILYDLKIEKEPEQVILTKTLSNIASRRK